MLRVTPLGDHDSSYVYFVAEGVLASNTRESTDSEGKTVVEGAQAGKENLYLWNGGETTFIATGVEYSPFGIPADLARRQVARVRIGKESDRLQQ